jgi:arylsulfatase A-like enzyme
VRILRNTFLLLFSLVLLSCSVAPRVPENTKRPNIVFILTDDMAASDLDFMPKTRALIQDQGVTFSQFLVNMAICCPSRATILRAQYSHNTKIVDNQPPGGGYEKFHALGREDSTIAVWLQSGGYRTALMGKYLNGYAPNNSRTYVPPGWTEWYSSPGDPFFNDAAYTGFNYTLNENGTLVQYGDAPEDYGTDVYAAKAVDFIHRSAQTGQPFFVYISTYAPHNPSTPAPRHASLFSDLKLPRPSSFNEEDVSDKSRYYARNPSLTEEDIALLEQKYRLRIQSLQAVDDMVESIVHELENSGQLDNTYIFFTSDNGFHLGQHRLPAGKATAFEEDIRVPLLVRGPGIKPGIVIDKLAGNVDFGPTFAELAGCQAGDFVDGRSLVPLLKGDFTWAWRKAYLLQRGSNPTPKGDGVDLSLLSSGLLQGEQEPADSPFDAKPGGAFVALRTDQYTYVEFLNGDFELYDIKKDPYQLENIAETADGRLMSRLHDWLSQLRKCSRSSCRSIERGP